MISSLQKTILLLHLLCLTAVLGQEFTITGKIIDESKQGIEGTEIILLQEGSITNSTISDKEGNFSLQNKPGIYSIRFYFVGTVIYQTDFKLDKDINLGTLESFDNSTQLREVEVTSKKRVIENQVDRTVFNVENSIRSNGSDGFELLKATPGVFVSANQIGIVGKSTVSVMIDDKIINLSGDELINYLRSISSENIKNIEVITTPPAKYDAQGNSGLINIKLKKAPEDSWAVNLRNYYMQNSYPSYLGGISFTYNKNKLSLFADYIKQTGHDRYWENLSNQFETESWDGRTKRKDTRDINRVAFTLDYKISEKARIGTKYIGLLDNPDTEDRNITDIIENSSNTTTSSFFTDGLNKNSITNHSVNVYYVQQLDTLGKQLSVDFDYFNYLDDQNRVFTTREFSPENTQIGSSFIANNTSIQDILNYSGKFDIEIPTKWASYDFGGKLSYVKNRSDIKFFDLSSGTRVLDINQTNVFDYSENTQSAYINFKKSLSEKWQTQIGFRYENTIVNGTTTSPDPTQNQEISFNYNRLFPSVYLTYTPGENHNFSVNYSKRIGRPDFWHLNPFKLYLNSFTIVEGNPFLQPSFTDNYEINYNYKENLSFKIYYSNTTEESTQLPLIETNGGETILRYFRDNFLDKYQLGGTITYYFDKISWWESSNTLNGFNNVTSFIKEVPTEERNGFQYHFYTYNSFNLNKSKSLKAELNYEFHSARRDLYYSATQYNKLDVGLRYSLKEKGLNFILLATDVFRSYQADFNSVVNNVIQNNNSYFDERKILVGVTYKFGNKKLSANQRESGNEEIQERLK
jgi:hypothetical protein